MAKRKNAKVTLDSLSKELQNVSEAVNELTTVVDRVRKRLLELERNANATNVSNMEYQILKKEYNTLARDVKVMTKSRVFTRRQVKKVTESVIMTIAGAICTGIDALPMKAICNEPPDHADGL